MLLFPGEIDRTIHQTRYRKSLRSAFEFHIRMPRFVFASMIIVLIVFAFAIGYLVNGKSSNGTIEASNQGYALPAKVVYIYAIPGPTVFANEAVHRSSRELKSEIHGE